MQVIFILDTFEYLKAKTCWTAFVDTTISIIMLLLIYENIGFIGLWPMSNVCSSTYIPFILHMLGSTHEHAYVLWVMDHCHNVGPVYS